MLDISEDRRLTMYIPWSYDLGFGRVADPISGEYCWNVEEAKTHTHKAVAPVKEQFLAVH
jgi:hypothetical protein